MCARCARLRRRSDLASVVALHRADPGDGESLTYWLCHPHDGLSPTCYEKYVMGYWQLPDQATMVAVRADDGTQHVYTALNGFLTHTIVPPLPDPPGGIPPRPDDVVR